MYGLVEEFRRARAEFGRAGGLVKSFFVRDAETREVAADYADALSAALRTFTGAGVRVGKAHEELREKLAPFFHDLEFAARRLSGR